MVDRWDSGNNERERFEILIVLLGANELRICAIFSARKVECQ